MRNVERETVGRPHHHVDQVDSVPHLGDGGARHHGVHDSRNRFRAQAQQPRLILVDADANLPARLDPIKIDLPAAGIRGNDLGQSESDIAHLVHVRTADAILHRPAHRRPELQRNGSGHRAREIVPQHALELHAQPLAGGDVLGDDHELAEEIVGELDAERQIEPDRAAPDIGAPALDIRVGAKDGIEPGRAIAAGVDRRILRQSQIDQKLRPVGRREKLSRHMGKGEEREHEAGERHQDGDPSHPHGSNEHPPKRP